MPHREEGVVPESIVINPDQREGLYELIRNHLGSIEDFWVAMERTEDFAAAERLGREFAQDFRLLEDIGWASDDRREEFGLTMATDELVPLLKRLHEEADQILVEHGTEAQSSREDAETDLRFHFGYEACKKVLADLDGELRRLFGENLERLRCRADLSQEELGFRAGLHRTEVGMLERGARMPRLDTIVKLAGGLEVEPAELLEYHQIIFHERFRPGRQRNVGLAVQSRARPKQKGSRCQRRSMPPES